MPEILELARARQLLILLSRSSGVVAVIDDRQAQDEVNPHLQNFSIPRDHGISGPELPCLHGFARGDDQA